MRTKVVLARLLIFLCRLASGQTELIVNGGFESGLPPWQLISTGAFVSNNVMLSHTGSRFLSLGNPANTVQGAYQVVHLPTNAVRAVLNFYWNVQTANGST